MSERRYVRLLFDTYFHWITNCGQKIFAINAWKKRVTHFKEEISSKVVNIWVTKKYRGHPDKMIGIWGYFCLLLLKNPFLELKFKLIAPFHSVYIQNTFFLLDIYMLFIKHSVICPFKFVKLSNYFLKTKW